MQGDLKMTCGACGSENISRNATVRWSEFGQAWEITGIFDDATCDDCDHEGAYNEVAKEVNDA